MSDGDDALARLRRDVRTRDADEGADDLEARLLFGLIDRADDRFDDLFGTDDDALFQTARGHDARTDDLEMIIFRDLGNQRTDFGRADIDPNDDAVAAHWKYGLPPKRRSINPAVVRVRASSVRSACSVATCPARSPC